MATAPRPTLLPGQERVVGQSRNIRPSVNFVVSIDSYYHFEKKTADLLNTLFIGKVRQLLYS